MPSQNFSAPNLDVPSSAVSANRSRLAVFARYFLATAIGYLLLCKLSVWLAAPLTSPTPVWFAEGFSLAVYLRAMRVSGTAWARVADIVREREAKRIVDGIRFCAD